MPLTADDVIRVLALAPHPAQGGYFRRTYRSAAAPGAPSATAKTERFHSRQGTRALFRLQSEYSTLEHSDIGRRTKPS